MNCGLPLKASGETDFPCMSGTRVGQGRMYVQLGKQDRVDYAQWCRASPAAAATSATATRTRWSFAVNGKSVGRRAAAGQPGQGDRRAKVAFSPETPLEPAYGGAIPVGGPRHVGDTVIMREALSLDPVYQRGRRLVEVVVNGRVAASREVPADGREHAVEFPVPIERSSWVAHAAVSPAPHEPGHRAGRGKTHPRVAGRALVGAGLHRSALARARAPNLAGRARGRGKGLRGGRAIYRRIASESPAER